MDLPRATQQEKEEKNLGAQGITLQTEGNPTLHSQYGDLALLQQAVTSWSRLAAFVLPSATLQLAFSGRLAQLVSNDFSFSSAHLQELGLLPQAARLSSTSCPENTFKIVPQSLGTCT